MTQECFNACYNLDKLAVNKQCFDNCYTKYVLTLRTVHNTLRDYGYRYQSLYAYKNFPQYDIWFETFYSNMLGDNRFPFHIEQRAVSGKVL